MFDEIPDGCGATPASSYYFWFTACFTNSIIVKEALKMYEAKLSTKNQIVIPRGARVPLGLKPADKLLIVVRGDMIILMRKPKRFSDALRGAGHAPYAEHYLQEERDSWK
jgi:AbrB family looped-hinge helix DNA binding protein